jgi:hypothetical protein
MSGWLPRQNDFASKIVDFGGLFLFIILIIIINLFLDVYFETLNLVSFFFRT